MLRWTLGPLPEHSIRKGARDARGLSGVPLVTGDGENEKVDEGWQRPEEEGESVVCCS